jgi:putative ABC transport system permease protein
MGYIIKLAVRNILRNKRRSLLAVLSVLLALFLMAFLEGFMNGMLANVTQNITKNESGHIKITTKEFHDRVRFMPVDANIQDPAAVIARLKADPVIGPRIDLTAMRITFGTILEYGGRNKTAMGIGGDMDTERKLLMLDRSIVEGRYIAGPRETVIGASLAADLGIGIGAVLKVQSATTEGSTNMRKFTVVGIFRTGLDTLDSAMFQVPLEDAYTLLKTGGGAQQILVMLKDYRQSDATAALMRKSLGNTDLAVSPWSETSDMFGFLSMMGSMFNAIYIFIAAIGTLIIVNIMMMVVLERRREIGIMKALGVSKGEILGIFTAEGFTLGILGSIAGVLLGLAITTVTSKTGIQIGTADSLKGMNFPMSNILYPAVTVSGLVKVYVIGVLTAGIVSILPARRAARMNAVSAIKSAL